VALRIGLGAVLLLGLVILGGWFFSGRGTTATVHVLGGPAGFG